MSIVEIKVPDIGDFRDVEVIEVLVNPGDTINTEDSLISIESDKAVMEIPAPRAGIVKQIHVAVGDKVSEGSLIVTLEASDAVKKPQAADIEKAAAAPVEKSTASVPKAASYEGNVDVSAEVVVLGSGPGGYTAAFRAADLGKQVVLIERYEQIGGVCLNVGCIPSKALLHTAQVINEAAEFHNIGIAFNKPAIDPGKLRGHKDKVVGRLTGGLKQLAKQRKVQIIQGYGKFPDVAHGDVVRETGQCPFLAPDHRHRRLHRRHVGLRDHAGPHVEGL